MQRVAPAEAFPPGEFLREELEARGWTQADLAEILTVSPQHINEIINGKSSITPETAKALGAAFGVDPRYWMNLESIYQLWRVRTAAGSNNIERRAKLFVKAPVREMIRRHWIETSNSVDVLEKRVLDFFEISSLDEEAIVWSAARKSTSYASVTPLQRAWLFRARQLARAVQAAPFSKVSFQRAMQTLKTLLWNREDVRHVPKVLAEAGIRFVVVEHLEQTRIDGACLWLEKKSPVVALSLRYDRIDAFWHTLMHELGHVQERHGLEGYAPLDVELLRESRIAEKDGPQEEKDADQFAVEFLIPQRDLDHFIRRVRPLYSATKITGFAALQKVHPGIVVGQLQHRGEIGYTYHRRMLEKVRSIVTQSALTDGWGHTPPAGL
ncbi:MAG: HigA family addiction module antidote protein [Armatimonadetes bacterium]|nr:HigA family addiction module antidote protein [Armatimonadota bacterium]